MAFPIRPGTGVNLTILSLLAQHPDGVWPARVRSAVGGGPNRASQALTRLTRHGFVHVERVDGHEVITLTALGALALIEARRDAEGSEDVHNAVHS